ncbi:MAG: diacylglycerol/polyprenol kinase family protein [Candidatus Sigynarchaeota archaeon]
MSADPAVNLLLMACSYAYGFIVIGIGRFLQRRLGKDASFTRKVIHLFAGYSSFVVFWFSPAFAWLAIIIGVSFTALLYMARPAGPLHAVFDSMARPDDRKAGGLGGPVYYAISLTVLTSICTFPLLPQLLPYFWIPASCLSMMFVGDGIAPIIGKRWGKHVYGNHGRTVEGSLAVFAGGFAGFAITLFIAICFATNQLVPGQIATVIIIGLVVSGINTAVEAISPSGYDNMTCPLVSTGAFVLLLLVFIA